MNTKKIGLFLWCIVGGSLLLQAQQISVVGTATPANNFTTDVNLSQTSPGIWAGAFYHTAGELKFRKNASWTNNRGGSFPSGTGVPSSPTNIRVSPAGTYLIQFNPGTLADSFTTVSPVAVGIGTPSPTEKLDVSGNIKTTGELKPNGLAGATGQVLTSNGNGTMRWAAASSAGGEESSGSGTWGDFSLNNVTAFQPMANFDGKYHDNFGASVAISGDFAMVGADTDDEGGFTDNGSASIYRRNAATGIWELKAKLTNSAPASNDYFGNSVAISGDYAMVGAFYDVEGGIVASGSATLYKRYGNIWRPLQKITDQAAIEGEWSGLDVGVDGNTGRFLIGASFAGKQGMVFFGKVK